MQKQNIEGHVDLVLDPVNTRSPSIADESRTHVDTATAAHWLCRRPHTLRLWSKTGGPIKPTRVHGRLAWPVSEIKQMLGVMQ
jgi:hypothetical protein